ncbi:cytochrome P460 family protein [Gemmata sp.]|uniref:cytochrome P460 family protein n=1 Tax=Gemmata sp. TaxID=1914242 RepID=UPI003F70EB88
MKRRAVLLLVFVAGCHQPPPSPPPAAPEAHVAPPPRHVSRAEVDLDTLDFAKWPTATEFPISVEPHVHYACGPGINSDTERWAKFGGKGRHGPHAKHSVVVRVNPEAMGAFKRVGTPLPAGTVVIKEKHPDWSAAYNASACDFGAMIKREAGYDPENGDWEYAYVAPGPAKQVTRGKLASCIDCHSHMKDRDYLFRTYLPNQVEGAQKRHPAVSDW